MADKNLGKNDKGRNRIISIGILLCIVWIIIIGTIFLLAYDNQRKTTIELAALGATASYNKDYEFTGIQKISFGYTIMLLSGLIILGTAFFKLNKQYQRQQAVEMALRESDERFNLAVNATQDGILDWNIYTNKVYFSPRCCEIIGYSFADPAFPPYIDSWISRIHPDDHDNVMEAINAHLEQNLPFNVDYKHKHKSGKYRWHNIRGQATFDKTGKPVRMVACIRDINRKTLTMESLRESAELHSFIIKTTMDGFWMADAEGRLVEVNDTYCHMSGYSKDELLSMHVSDLEVNKSSIEMKRHVEKIISQGRDRFESQHLHKDGKTFDVEISIQYLPAKGGRFIAFIRNITVQKKMEARIQQSQRMESIGTLAGGIAHDFNNILSPIMIHAEMAMEEIPLDNQAQEDLKQIRIASKRAKDLVQQILTFSRQSSQEVQPLKIGLIIKEAVKLIRSTVPTTISLKYSIRTESDAIYADPVQVHQVIMNLCTNAVHAMRENGGELYVSLSDVEITTDLLNSHPKLTSTKSYLKLRVSDTGTGIPINIKDRIFDPFFTTKEKGEGTGMGLSVVHGIINACGGSISVESGQGKGTIFDIFLPKAEIMIEKESDIQGIPPKGKEKILFVDDEKAMVDAYERMLKKLGYHVTTKTSSIEALETFKNNPDAYDLVITDMTMPTMRGDQLAYEIRQIRKDMPIILCTGFSEKINDEITKELGISSFMMKPIIVSEMAVTVRKILDKNEV